MGDGIIVASVGCVDQVDNIVLLLLLSFLPSSISLCMRTDPVGSEVVFPMAWVFFMRDLNRQNPILFFFVGGQPIKVENERGCSFCGQLFV